MQDRNKLQFPERQKLSDLQPCNAAMAFGVYQRAKGVLKLADMSKSTFYAIQDPGSGLYDPTFPDSYQLTARTRVWKTEDIIAWVESRKITKRAVKFGIDEVVK